MSKLTLSPLASGYVPHFEGSSGTAKNGARFIEIPARDASRITDGEECELDGEKTTVTGRGKEYIPAGKGKSAMVVRIYLGLNAPAASTNDAEWSSIQRLRGADKARALHDYY